jgi:hypothetical protein
VVDNKPQIWAVVTKVIGFKTREEAIAYRDKVRSGMESINTDIAVSVEVKNKKEVQ